LRLILQDYRHKISRNDVTEKTKQLLSDKWAKFSMASLFLNMHNSGQPPCLLSTVSKNLYSKRRKPSHLFAFDSSRTRIGKQATRNWIGNAINPISNPRCNRVITKDTIRVLLKKTYHVE